MGGLTDDERLTVHDGRVVTVAEAREQQPDLASEQAELRARTRYLFDQIVCGRWTIPGFTR